LDNALDEAWAVIVENRHVLDRLVAELLERETLNEHDLAEIFADVRKRPLREVWTSSSERPTLEAPKVGGTTTATGTEEHDAGEPMQPNPPELPHPGGDDPEIPGAAREGGPGGTGVWHACRPAARAGRGPGDPRRDRRGPRPRRPAGHARPGGPDVPGGVLRPGPGRPGAAGNHLRHRPPGVGAGARYRLPLHVRASPAAVLRDRPRGLHPRRGKGHRAQQARPAGPRLCPPAAGAGAHHLADRRRPDGRDQCLRRDRGDRGRAHVHVHARGASRRGSHRHQRGARHAAGQPQHPRRGDEPHQSELIEMARSWPDGLPARLAGDDTLVMGVLNVTPDSFSDGGRYEDPVSAVAHGRTLIAQGASIVDVGGESTRPGAPRVDEQEERARVVPVVAELAAEDVVVSVDTMRASVAAASVEAGALIVNDVSAGRADEDMGRQSARLRTRL